MSFSQRAAVNVVPFLARVVLGAVFIIAGWNKIMTEHTFTPEEVSRLQAVGVNVDPGVTPVPPVDTASETPSPPGGARLRALHGVTLLVESRQWPYAGWAGWATAAVELLGGGLVLVGLFSRLWALGLAAIMVGAFILTSLPVLRETWVFLLPPLAFSTLVVQAALFVLAFGIVLTGPGALSLDRMLFRREPAPID